MAQVPPLASPPGLIPFPPLTAQGPAPIPLPTGPGSNTLPLSNPPGADLALNAPNTSGPTGMLPASVPSDMPGPFFPFYTPSFDLALAGSVTVSAVTVMLIILTLKTKAWFFFTMSFAALAFAIAMILRLVVVVTDQKAATAFIISTSFLTSITSLISLMLISVYTRLIWWITPSYLRNIGTLWLPVRYTTVILATVQTVGDILIFVGSGQLIKTPGRRTTPIGTIISLLVWIFLATLVTRFVYISRRWLMDEHKRDASLQLGLALSTATIFLVIRGFMQVIENDALKAASEAPSSPPSIIVSMEWPVWVFNFLPNVAMLVIVTVFFPGYYFPRRLMGWRLKTKELLEERKSDKRESIASSAEMAISWPIRADP